MARIIDCTLDPIQIDVANADAVLHATVTFSKSDQDANTPYRMTAALVGDDPVGEFPAEAPGNDVIANGTLTPDGGQIIRADGVGRLEFEFRKTLALEDLNEDVSHNPDEIKGRVTLTPIVATATEAESNVRTLTA